MATKLVELINIDTYAITHDTRQNLAEVINWLTTKLADVPEPYRDTATIEFYSYDGSDVTELVIEYDRPETREEAAERDRAETNRALAAEAFQRQQYEILKAKFEPAQ